MLYHHFLTYAILCYFNITGKIMQPISALELAGKINVMLLKYQSTKVCVCAHDEGCKGCDPESLFNKLRTDLLDILYSVTDKAE